MNLETILIFSQWFFLAFFVVLNLVYLSLNTISLLVVSRYGQWKEMHELPHLLLESKLPISILAPAFNEEKTIVSSVHSLLQLNYLNYELIVINDGSSDQTLEILKKSFDLLEVPEFHDSPLKTKKIRGAYRSKTHPNFRVIDKENGGKADSLNAGLNYCRTPLYCCIDADSMLARNSLQRVVEPFLQDETTIATGGTIRIVNGCTTKQGNLLKANLPKNPLALFQIVEYLRAFLFGRMGWSALNGMLIISGAFGAFKKDIVLEVGGYRHNTVGEDMELVVRLHRHMRLNRRPYQITFVPDPVCWTEAPEDLKTLRNQRIRWQRGLSESLTPHLKLLFNPKGGVISWLAYPFMLFFEFLEPLILVGGTLLTLICFYFGLISMEALIVFFVTVVGTGILLSTNALLLEELSFHIYPRLRYPLYLYCMAILENFGYRQLNSYWRFLGLFRWAFGKKGNWGKMERIGRS